MGNRAVITTSDNIEPATSDKVGVYLHWNGGRDSVEAFLMYCKLQGYRTPESDSYGWARLCQITGNYFGGGTSLGIDSTKNLDCDNYDNGVYLIENWEIVGRLFHSGTEQSEYKLEEMLEDINDAQPEAIKIDVKAKLEELKAKKVEIY